MVDFATFPHLNHEAMPDHVEDIKQSFPGKSNKAIGGTLWISEHTVEKHVNSIFAKLQLPNNPEEHRRVLAVLSYLETR